MKKVILLLTFFISSSFLFAQTTPVLVTPLTVSPEGILLLHGSFYVGPRTGALGYEAVILAQPLEKNLMLLHEDGSGGCFLPANKILFIQKLGTGIPTWKKVTDSYSLGGSITGASIQNNILYVSYLVFQTQNEYRTVQFNVNSL